ncbi:hypothetical protein PHO31112_00770 [Pandoraea horticolens]|uniref:Uncharacterized protein n=1 Tax=Pandoraea horticolens TaxID=2508298 RepID=A0A5E4SFF9_9BURK|nr:hypothetical protein [Pandoraea horticolens]VVD74626.1 hypothetical protein PHO31112_00770 [Pandoraea horticolens]
MTKEQLNVIVGLLAGTQTAVVTLADYLSKSGVLSKSDLAQHFSATVTGLPEEMNNRALIAMVLRQISDGLNAVQDQTAEDQIRKLLH